MSWKLPMHLPVFISILSVPSIHQILVPLNFSFFPRKKSNQIYNGALVYWKAQVSVPTASRDDLQVSTLPVLLSSHSGSFYIIDPYIFTSSIKSASHFLCAFQNNQCTVLCMGFDYSANLNVSLLCRTYYEMATLTSLSVQIPSCGVA